MQKYFYFSITVLLPELNSRVKGFFLLMIFVTLVVFYFDTILTPVQGVGGFTSLPPATMGNRTIDLAVKLYSNSTTPLNVNYLWLRFFDANTNQTVRHISFILTISKGKEILLNDTFHTHTGVLSLRINQTGIPEDKWVIRNAYVEPYSHGWVPEKNDEQIFINAPIFADSSAIYYLHITMYTIDYDSNFFSINGNPIYSTFSNIHDLNMEKTIAPTTENSTNSVNLSCCQKPIQLGNMSIPEFPLAIPVLLIGITSLIVFYRMKIEKFKRV